MASPGRDEIYRRPLQDFHRKSQRPVSNCTMFNPGNPIKSMKLRILMAALAIGLGAGVLAAETRDYPVISLVGPGGSKNPVSRDQFILLVVEGPYITYEKTPIPDGSAVDFINDLLKAKDVTYLGVYIREGVKYGDVVKSLDTLRQTNAKNIGVSMAELPAGREL
jgi:hypothetical protein